MANKKIKGLTVEIGGDTTKLGKAIEDSKKKSKSLQSELKQVEKLLKLDPANVELVAQKQKILTEQVEETKKRLSLLKDEQSKVNELFNSGEIGAEEYRKYQREVEQTRIELESLETQYSETMQSVNGVDLSTAKGKVGNFKDSITDLSDTSKAKMDELANNLNTVGNKIESVGTTISTTVSSAATKVLSNSVEAFEDLDEGYDVIVKKTGATDDKLESLKRTANEVFSNSTFDMTAIGNVIGEVNTRFGFTEDKLRSVTEQYLQFAKINDTDVSDSVSKSSRIMQAWNISAENLPDLLGMITAKGQETGVSVDSLMDKVLTNNSTFKEMGLTLEESITLMAQFEKNGVNDSTALMAMKTAVKNAAREGKSLSEALSENVNDIKNASSETEALQKATALFGSRGAAEMANAIKEGRIDFDNLSGSMSNYKDTVKKTYDATVDPLEKSQKVINNLKLAGVELAETALKEGEPLIEDVIEGVKGVTNWLKKLTPEQKKTLTKAIEIIAVVGPGVTVVGKLTKGMGNIVSTIPKLITKLTAQTTATTAATTAQEGLNAAQSANPIGAVITVVVALATALWGLKSAIDAANEQRLEDLGFTAQAAELETMVGKVQELQENVKGLADSVSDSMKTTENDMTVIDTYKTRLNELLDKADLSSEEQAELVTIGDYFSDKYDDFKTAWDHYISVDDEGKVHLIGNADEIKSSLNELIDSYKKVAANAALANLSQENTEASVTAQQDVSNSALELKKAKQALIDFKNEWNFDTDDFNNPDFYTWQNLDATKTATVGDLKSQYQTLVDAIGSAESAYDSTCDSAAQLQVNSQDLAKMQAVVNGNYDDASAVLMAYNSHLIDATQIESSRWESLDKLKEAAKETAEETGSNIVFGMSNGIDKYKSEIYANGLDTAKELLEAMKGKDGLDEHSPSKKMYEIGKNAVWGFINGLKDGSSISNLWNSAKDIASTALNSIKSFLGIASPSKEAAKLGRFTAQGFAEGLENGNPEALRKAEELAETARKALGGNLDLLDINAAYAPSQTQILTDYSVTHTHDFQQSSELKGMRNDIKTLSAKIEELAKNPSKLYLDGKTLVGGTIGEIDSQLADLEFTKNRGG